MKPSHIFILLFLAAIFTFILRLATTSIPLDDPLYNLRQIDSLVANNLSYAWFDPLNWYHSTATIFWGPLFPTIIATICIVTKVNSVAIASIVPPILASIITVTSYFLGKSFNDWKTGLIASVFTAVIGGQYFYRSTFGFIDHHIAEVLFSTLFCLLYIYALRSTTTNKTIIISFFAGIVYLLGYLTMPTMVLFAMIVGIFTVASFVISQPDKKLVLINTVVFGTVIIGTLLFGFKTTGYDLSSYSIGHPIVYLGLIIFTVLLYLLASNVSTKTLVGILALISLLFVTISQFLKITFVTYLLAFFGQSNITNTVAEAQGWNLIQAALSFNIGLLLAICGAIVLVLIYVRSHNNSILFVLIWSMII
ncbi:MAG: STT3 domain-containing protein, partial [Candidatus Paceibacterota bacterium]